ncbi:MAG: HPr(Ser) kinase/phosphatase [Tissierellia bacterium]|nr:HPr(Ser) kinase/phosphatase [Tissierellia bacterium]
MKKVKIATLAERLNLDVIKKASDYDEVGIRKTEINRPGLQLTGFMEEFPYQNIQVIGKAEMAYMQAMDPGLRYERVRGILSYDIPCLIFTHGAIIPYEVIELAQYYNKTLLSSTMSTTRLISKIDDILTYELCPETRLHASLLEIYGVGVLIMGESSVGKSETALDLIIRGHTLVADDVVDVRKLENRLVAECPKMIRHFLEIRGLGILDIQRLYGLGSVKAQTNIDVVISLERWDDSKEYDRVGIDEDIITILGVDIPRKVVPVKPGRNIAMIVEVAVRNHRQRAYGYNAAVALNERIKENLREQQ